MVVMAQSGRPTFSTNTDRATGMSANSCILALSRVSGGGPKGKIPLNSEAEANDFWRNNCADDSIIITCDQIGRHVKVRQYNIAYNRRE